MSLCSLVLATTGKAAGRRPCRTELVHANHGEAEGGSRAGGEEDDMDAISGEKAKQRRLGSSTGRLDAGSEEGRRDAEAGGGAPGRSRRKSIQALLGRREAEARGGSRTEKKPLGAEEGNDAGGWR